MNIKILLSCALLSGVAQANDSAVYEIPVQGIDPMESTINSDLVKFYGKEAADFMKLLPPVKTVPPDTDWVAKHIHELLVTSKGYTLSFYCSDVIVSQGPDGNLVREPNENGVECKISLNEPNEDVDAMNFRRNDGAADVIKQLK